MRAKTLGKINGLWAIEEGFGASEHALWATAITLWATGNTVWATVFTVAQTVNPPLGHEKRAPEGALHTLLCKYTTNRGEMQIALFRCFSAKPCVGKQAFPIFTNRRLRRIVVPRPLTWYSVLHRGVQPRYLFLGVLVGVASDVATSTESHVNGHGSTIGARHDTKS